MRRPAARLAVFIAAGATAALVAACGGPSPSGDARACQMVKQEMGQFLQQETSQQVQRLTAAAAAATSPGLKRDIGGLAYAVSLESQPAVFAATDAGPAAEGLVTLISETCANDGVSGLCGLGLDSLALRQGGTGPVVVHGPGFLISYASATPCALCAAGSVPRSSAPCS